MNHSPRRLFRMIIPAYPFPNIYTGFAKKMTALGPLLVAASANKLPSWDVEVVDENNCAHSLCPRDRLGRPDHARLQEEKPAAAVGFYGSMTSTIPRVFELAGLYKEFGARTVAGGKHVETLPGEALSHGIDVVVRGDGEETIRDLLAVWEAGEDITEVAGIAYPSKGQVEMTADRPPLADFTRMPRPDFGLLRYGTIEIFPLSWWRGCPYNCEFCAVKGQMRRAPAEWLVSLVAHLVETRGARNFFLVDDHFGGNFQNPEHRQEMMKFCRLMADYRRRVGRKLSFAVQIRLNAAAYPELLEAMKEAGVNSLCIGYESPLDEELSAMRKGYRCEHMIQWTRIFHQFGFFVHGMFMFGYPRKEAPPAGCPALPSREKVRRFRRFITQAKVDTVQVLLTVPVPGTDLYRRLEAEDRIYPLNQIGWEYYDGQFPVFEPDDGINPEELQQSVKMIMGRFYHFHHFWKIALNILFHFPRIILPATFTLIALKVRYINSAYEEWYKKYFRNQSLRFAGHFILREWVKKFREGNFPERLMRSRARHSRNQGLTA